ncbi:MAG: hypothetical protein ACR2OW_11445, partial [Methyloligellaceae bacterium]
MPGDQVADPIMGNFFTDKFAIGRYFSTIFIPSVEKHLKIGLYEKIICHQVLFRTFADIPAR